MVKLREYRALGGAAQLAASLGRRFGLTNVLVGAVVGYVAVATILVVAVASGMDNLAMLMALLFMILVLIALIVPAVRCWRSIVTRLSPELRLLSPARFRALSARTILTLRTSCISEGTKQ